MFVFAEKLPGLSVQYLESLPFYEFHEYRLLLDKKIDAENKEVQNQQNEFKNTNAYKKPYIPKASPYKAQKFK